MNEIQAEIFLTQRSKHVNTFSFCYNAIQSQRMGSSSAAVQAHFQVFSTEYLSFWRLEMVPFQGPARSIIELEGRAIRRPRGVDMVRYRWTTHASESLSIPTTLSFGHHSNCSRSKEALVRLIIEKNQSTNTSSTILPQENISWISNRHRENIMAVLCFDAFKNTLLI